MSSDSSPSVYPHKTNDKNDSLSVNFWQFFSCTTCHFLCHFCYKAFKKIIINTSLIKHRLCLKRVYRLFGDSWNDTQMTTDSGLQDVRLICLSGCVYIRAAWGWPRPAPR